MGAIYKRIFRDVYPNKVGALVFLNSSYPEQWNRLAENRLFKGNQLTSVICFLFLRIGE
jgi:hypothetical protein